MARTRPRLHRDEDLGVLWLSARRAEVALSREGIWVRAGRKDADLPWREIEQVQQSKVRWERARIEVFRRDGSAYSIGPFPAAQGQRWVRAAGDAAVEAGLAPQRLDGAGGFALRSRA
jgi:hypothetical protein